MTDGMEEDRYDADWTKEDQAAEDKAVTHFIYATNLRLDQPAEAEDIVALLHYMFRAGMAHGLHLSGCCVEREQG